jgi:hypothetical protein
VHSKKGNTTLSRGGELERLEGERCHIYKK